jgi:hypothetical protein
MKRVLLASIIGMAAVASSFGQGMVLFDNYSNSQGQVLFTTDLTHIAPFDASLAGLPVGSEFNLALFAINGTTGSSVGMQQIGSGFISQGAGNTPDGDLGAGYFAIGSVTVPSYVPGSAASFLLEAYLGASYATSTYKGSVIWTEPSSSITQSVTDGKGAFMAEPSFYVAGETIVPEPTTFALLGLGSAALLIFRRK